MLFSINKTSVPFDEYPGGWEASGAWYLHAGAGDVRVFALHQQDHVGVQIQRDAFTGYLHSATAHTFVAAHWQRPLPSGWTVAASGGTDHYAGTEDAGVMQLDRDDSTQSGRLDVAGVAASWRVAVGQTMAIETPGTSGRVPIAGGDFAGTAGVKTFDVARRAWTTGSFVDATRTFGRLTPELGVRTDYQSSAGTWTLDPRAAVVFALTPNQRLRLATGLYHQAAAGAYRGEGGATLPPTEARHLIVGYEAGSLTRSAFFRIEAYDKRYRHLPLQDGTRFDASGYGHARGVDAFVTRVWPKVTLRANASWLDAARRWTPWDQQSTYPIPAAGTWRPDFDIPYSFEAVSAVRLSRTLTLDAAWRTAAGRPSTPVVGTVAGAAGYLPVWGAINSDRLPGYDRLDVSVSRTLRISGRPAIFFASAGNALDRRNVSAWVYSPDFRTRTTVPSGSPRNLYFGITIR
jgi:hypothetical protein